MGLIDQYQEAENAEGTELTARGLTAMINKIVATLFVLPVSDQYYKLMAQLAREVLNTQTPNAKFFTRALIEEGVTQDSTDQEIETVINAKFEHLARIFNPNLL